MYEASDLVENQKKFHNYYFSELREMLGKGIIVNSVKYDVFIIFKGDMKQQHIWKGPQGQAPSFPCLYCEIEKH